MIKLSLNKSDVDNLNKQISMKVEAIGYMKDPYFLDAVCRAAFVIVSKRFVVAVDKFASMNPKAMHHVYEWNMIGRPNGRLFVLNRTKLMSGTSLIQVSFLKSKVPVPVDPELIVPGKSGKFVNSKNVFKNKAEIMENGTPVDYVAQKFQPFITLEGMKFIRPGQRVYIQYPGGKYVKKSFENFMTAWYAKNSQPIMDSSGLYEKIASEASLILSKSNTGINDIKYMVDNIVNSITLGSEVVK
jgi:hypothetical protein